MKMSWLKTHKMKRLKEMSLTTRDIIITTDVSAEAAEVDAGVPEEEVDSTNLLTIWLTW